jgi:hypothetical protein
VHLYWHSFDLAVTRFSGRRAPEREGADRVTREAYSHEVISFGFWPGDKDLREACLLLLRGPRACGPHRPTARTRDSSVGSEGGTALLMYEDVWRATSPKATLLAFLGSVYLAGARTAGWDEEEFRAEPVE